MGIALRINRSRSFVGSCLSVKKLLVKDETDNACHSYNQREGEAEAYVRVDGSMETYIRVSARRRGREYVKYNNLLICP